MVLHCKLWSVWGVRSPGTLDITYNPKDGSIGLPGHLPPLDEDQRTAIAWCLFGCDCRGQEMTDARRYVPGPGSSDCAEIEISLDTYDTCPEMDPNSWWVSVKRQCKGSSGDGYVEEIVIRTDRVKVQDLGTNNSERASRIFGTFRHLFVSEPLTESCVPSKMELPLDDPISLEDIN